MYRDVLGCLLMFWAIDVTMKKERKKKERKKKKKEKEISPHFFFKLITCATHTSDHSKQRRKKRICAPPPPFVHHPHLCPFYLPSKIFLPSSLFLSLPAIKNVFEKKTNNILCNPFQTVFCRPSSSQMQKRHIT